MKTENFYRLGLTALLCVTLAACTSSGSDMEAEEEARRAEEEAARQQAEEEREREEARAQAAQEEEDEPTAEELREEEMLDTTVFYFEFDKSDLMPEAREALVYHANRLKENPDMSVRLEGHADERGTREYNLALGERRAQAVERYLQVQGVSSSQLETVSYGEERPAVDGTSESAYEQNRRVEMKY